MRATRLAGSAVVLVTGIVAVGSATAASSSSPSPSGGAPLVGSQGSDAGAVSSGSGGAPITGTGSVAGADTMTGTGSVASSPGANPGRPPGAVLGSGGASLAADSFWPALEPALSVSQGRVVELDPSGRPVALVLTSRLSSRPAWLS